MCLVMRAIYTIVKHEIVCRANKRKLTKTNVEFHAIMDADVVLFKFLVVDHNKWISKIIV